MVNTNLKTIRINSFNCRGIRNANKRANIFTWLKQNYFGITFLQETHSAIIDHKKWQQEWGGKSFFHMGNSIQGGLQY